MENKEEPKKCYCARCFLPVHEDDKVDIEGQNFHRICSMCCVCRCIPKSIKMFYGHVFCNECFKTHVLSRFRGEGPKMQTNSWWMQWAPGPKPLGTEEKTDESKSKSGEEPQKRCICSRCLQAVDENDKVDIGNQSFHPQCAKCYFCHKVPKHHVKIYYGQVFCEDCFNKHVMSKGSNPSDFFKTCFEQWQNNTQFADNMRQFMATNKECSPYVFMMQGQPSCRCGGSGNEWDSHSEARKCKSVDNNWWRVKTPKNFAANAIDLRSYGDSSDQWNAPPFLAELDITSSESDRKNVPQAKAAEKIEKLTKYLHEESDLKFRKKWKNYVEIDKMSISSGWVDIQDKSVQLDCPKCLWQCGPIYVSSETLNKVCL